MKDYDERVQDAHTLILDVVPESVGIPLITALEIGEMAMFIISSTQIGVGARAGEYDGIVDIAFGHVEWQGVTYG